MTSIADPRNSDVEVAEPRRAPGSSAPLLVLVVGASGSIGRLVVEETLRRGHSVRALVRSAQRSAELPPEARAVVGDLTREESLAEAVKDVDAVVFVHGFTGGDGKAFEAVDYGGVRAVLHAVGRRRVRITLMTAIGVTHRLGDYNRRTGAPDWKRRSERLVRATGFPYTIVRPGWFDMNGGDEHRLVLLQGQRPYAGDSSDGVVSRRQIAEVLVRSLSSRAAIGKTFELVATNGPAPDDLDALFAVVRRDPPGALDGFGDVANMPLDAEPPNVRDDLRVLTHPASDGEA